jgi:hypothetical protein
MVGVGTEGRANWAFTLGLASLLLGVLGPPALVLGWRSLRTIAASSGSLKGEGRAIFGLLTGSLSTSLLVFGVARFVVVGLL